jgi:O-succinylbenzoate synthase
MKIEILSLHTYELSFRNGLVRSGAFLNICNEEGVSSWGEIAPLPNWSKESLQDALQEVIEKETRIKKINWTFQTLSQDLTILKLLPSVQFGLESALLSILHPLSNFNVFTSALLMGTPKEIIKQAELRSREGFTSAKLKVSNLDFKEASEVIHQLKDQFFLRIDVNRAWNTEDSIRFFEQFPLDTFDYVEEPFRNPNDLSRFLHPLAIDESFPQDLSLAHLDRLPTLKAIIYKPTMQGGMTGCLSMHNWTKQRGINLVLSSSFESDLGLAHIASLAHRLSLSSPIGIGTYFYLNQQICIHPLHFSQSSVKIPKDLIPKNNAYLQKKAENC